MSRTRLASAARLAVRLAFAAAALACLLWLLSRIGWGRVAHTLARIGFGGAAFVLFLGAAEALLDAAALRALLPGRIALWRMFAYHNAGAFVNAFIPLEAGEVAKGALLRPHVGARSAAAATIVCNYLYKVTRPCTSLTAALVGVALGCGLRPGVVAVVLAAQVAAFLPYVVLRFVIRRGAAEKVVRVAQRLRMLRRDPQAWLEGARRLDTEILDAWRLRRASYLRAFALQCAARTMAWLALHATLTFLGASASVGQTLVIYAALNVAEYLMLVLPARVGAAESAAFVVFRWLALDGAVGLLTSLVLRLRSITVNGSMAPLALIPAATAAAPPAAEAAAGPLPSAEATGGPSS